MKETTQAAWTALNWMDRSEIVEILTSYNIQCFDDESTSELRGTLLYNIQDGTIPEDVLGIESDDNTQERNLQDPGYIYDVRGFADGPDW